MQGKPEKQRPSTWHVCCRRAATFPPASHGCVMHIPPFSQEVPMSELRDRFVEALELKGHRKRTIRNYVQVVKQFSEFIKCSPVKMARAQTNSHAAAPSSIKNLPPIERRNAPRALVFLSLDLMPHLFRRSTRCAKAASFSYSNIPTLCLARWCRVVLRCATGSLAPVIISSAGQDLNCIPFLLIART